MKDFIAWLICFILSLAATAPILGLIFGSPFILMLMEMGVDAKWAACGFFGGLLLVGLIAKD